MIRFSRIANISKFKEESLLSKLYHSSNIHAFDSKRCNLLAFLQIDQIRKQIGTCTLKFKNIVNVLLQEIIPVS